MRWSYVFLALTHRYITEPADVLETHGARPPAGAVMIQSKPWAIYSFFWLVFFDTFTLIRWHITNVADEIPQHLAALPVLKINGLGQERQNFSALAMELHIFLALTQ